MSVKHVTRCVLVLVDTDTGAKEYVTTEATVRSHGDRTILTIPGVQSGLDLKVYVERLGTIPARVPYGWERLGMSVN